MDIVYLHENELLAAYTFAPVQDYLPQITCLEPFNQEFILYDFSNLWDKDTVHNVWTLCNVDQLCVVSVLCDVITILTLFVFREFDLGKTTLTF